MSIGHMSDGVTFNFIPPLAPARLGNRIDARIVDVCKSRSVIRITYHFIVASHM